MKILINMYNYKEKQNIIILLCKSIILYVSDLSVYPFCNKSVIIFHVKK
jgi:hypothetical protein